MCNVCLLARTCVVAVEFQFRLQTLDTGYLKTLHGSSGYFLSILQNLQKLLVSQIPNAEIFQSQKIKNISRFSASTIDGQKMLFPYDWSFSGKRNLMYLEEIFDHMVDNKVYLSSWIHQKSPEKYIQEILNKNL